MTYIPQLTSFTFLHQIGEGGMAKVYLAEHKTLGHLVAIKVLSKEFSYNNNIRSRFIDEAKKMARMDHPNVVKVTDLINDPDSVAIVMEYVNGETLKDMLSRKKLTDVEIENYLKQMVSALEYVHNQGLIHRDIKPSNFILSKDGNLKLTDFGISKALESNNSEHTQTSTAMSLGTPMYMSPEQVRSTKDVKHLTDIYSLGVVLWEMVSVKKPYDGNTLSTFEIQMKIFQEDLPLSKTFWDKVIQKATQKDETKRFQSAEEFLLALDNKEIVENDFEKTVFTEKTPKEDVEEQKNKKKKVLIFLSLGVLLVFSSIFFFMNSQEIKNKAKKEHQIKLVQQNEKEKIELQKEIDSLEVIAEQRKNDSLKLVLELETKNKLKIGKKHQGGIVFYLDKSGIHGKVCTERKLGVLDWDSAMKLCENLNLNGYSDWYLPSIEELELLYIQKHFFKGLYGTTYYWSNSEGNGNGAHIFAFDYGYSNYYEKSLTFCVRAVRAF